MYDVVSYGMFCRPIVLLVWAPSLRLPFASSVCTNHGQTSGIPHRQVLLPPPTLSGVSRRTLSTYIYIYHIFIVQRSMYIR